MKMSEMSCSEMTEGENAAQLSQQCRTRTSSFFDSAGFFFVPGPHLLPAILYPHIHPSEKFSSSKGLHDHPQELK